MFAGYDAWRTSPPPERPWPVTEFTRPAEVDLPDLYIDAECTFTAEADGSVSLVDARFAGRCHSAAQLEALIGPEAVAAIEAEAARWWQDGGADEWVSGEADERGEWERERREDCDYA